MTAEPEPRAVVGRCPACSHDVFGFETQEGRGLNVCSCACHWSCQLRGMHTYATLPDVQGELVCARCGHVELLLPSTE